MGKRQLENARMKLNEAIAEAVPGVNVDFTADITETAFERYNVQLRALTKKGEMYLPYLSEYIKLHTKEKEKQKK